MLDLDLASQEFLRFEKSIKRRGIRWVTSRDDAQRIRALSAGWMKEYRPVFESALGEVSHVMKVDEDVMWLRSRADTRTASSELCARLRRIARIINRELLPAYDANRWSLASNMTNRAEGNLSEENRSEDGPILSRLRAVDVTIARSYEQARMDMNDPDRLTYVGPAAELREVLGATIRRLSPPDEEIAKAPWFKGHHGKPTQAERVRAIMGDKDRSAPATQTLEIIDQAIGSVARATYQHASAVAHLGKNAVRDEVAKLRTWVEAVLGEILPAGD